MSDDQQPVEPWTRDDKGGWVPTAHPETQPLPPDRGGERFEWRKVTGGPIKRPEGMSDQQLAAMGFYPVEGPEATTSGMSEEDLRESANAVNDEITGMVGDCDSSISNLYDEAKTAPADGGGNGSDRRPDGTLRPGHSVGAATRFGVEGGNRPGNTPGKSPTAHLREMLAMDLDGLQAIVDDRTAPGGKVACARMILGAAGGDVANLREFFDRSDGKPPQATTIRVEDGRSAQQLLEEATRDYPARALPLPEGDEHE